MVLILAIQIVLKRCGYFTNLELSTDFFSDRKSLSHAEETFHMEMMKIVKLVLVMEATNATGEQSFSELHILKTWLHTTTAQSRLNKCTCTVCRLLQVHKTIDALITFVWIVLKLLLLLFCDYC